MTGENKVYCVRIFFVLIRQIFANDSRFATLRSRAARPFCRVATFPLFDGEIAPKVEGESLKM